MQKNLIITLLFSIVIAVFAILNAAPIRVNLIFSKVEISAALVILISAALGALLIYSIDVVTKMKSTKTVKGLEKDLQEAQSAFMHLKGQYDDLVASVQTKSEQSAIQEAPNNQTT